MSDKAAKEAKRTFAKRLNYYMNKKGITQADIVSEFNLTASTVSDWCNAKKYPRVDKIQLLADYFGILKSDLTEEHKNKTIKLSVIESLYNQLDSEDKAEIRGEIKQMLKAPKYKKAIKVKKSQPHEDGYEMVAYGADGTEGTFTMPEEETT